MPHSLPCLPQSLLHIPCPAHVGHDISCGTVFSCSINHVVSCSIRPQALSLVCSTSLLFSLPCTSGDWAVTLCVFRLVEFISSLCLSYPDFLQLPKTHSQCSSAASKALRNLQESLLLPAREAETSEKSHPCLTKLLIAPC